ncbi:MAG: glycine cleavage system aminomethyltransferase GcvT [Myxococcales bacterium]|nr:glycine cleavage system aminomethyltransferase GcvT [Myxococcales bacterium]
MSSPRRTPLYALHKQLGAKTIDFGGWDMPVQYPTGTIAEHKAVRAAAGLFDVSHMGEFVLKGPGAQATVARLATNDVAGAAVGKAVYSLLCLPSGGIVDDCIFYKRADDHYFVIVNASNIGKDLAWMREHNHGTCDLIDVSDETSLIAIQGPRAVEIVDKLADSNVSHLPSFSFTDCHVAGIAATVARTGYTGEDGFELAVANADAERLWRALLETGTPLGCVNVGLGARDSLRLEAKLPLYGNDIDATTSPLEAQLGWAVKLDRHDFIGKDALLAQKQQGVTRQLVGFTIAERAIARHGYAVVDRSASTSAALGTVTSGGPGISVPGSIGMAYVPTAFAAPGTSLTIDCRGKDVAATVVKGKFYKRPA